MSAYSDTRRRHLNMEFYASAMIRGAADYTTFCYAHGLVSGGCSQCVGFPDLSWTLKGPEELARRLAEIGDD